MSGSTFDEYCGYFADSRARLVGEAYCLTGDVDAAQSIARDVLIRAYVRWPECIKDDRPEIWEAQQVRDLAATAGGSRGAGGSARRAQSRAELGAEQAALLRASFALAPEEREALVFHAVAGLSTDELSEVQGVREETVTTRLEAALWQIADVLGVGGRGAGDGAAADDLVADGMRGLASFAASRTWMFSPVDARKKGRLRRGTHRITSR